SARARPTLKWPPTRACTPAVSAASSASWPADWPGAMRRRTREAPWCHERHEILSCCVCLRLNGPCRSPCSQNGGRLAVRRVAGRPVVLKVMPRRAREHLRLARLQHTHIVPLHAAYEFPDRGLRVLCLPYLGGATLAQVLKQLHGLPLSQRTGRALVAALDVP